MVGKAVIEVLSQIDAVRDIGGCEAGIECREIGGHGVGQAARRNASFMQIYGGEGENIAIGNRSPALDG